MPTASSVRSGRSDGHDAERADQLGARQHVRHVALVAGQHGELREDLLILDVASALDAYPLHGEIEAQLIVRRDVVVIDARPKELAGAGTRRLQGEDLLARAQREGRGARRH